MAQGSGVNISTLVALSQLPLFSFWFESQRVEAKATNRMVGWRFFVSSSFLALTRCCMQVSCVVDLTCVGD